MKSRGASQIENTAPLTQVLDYMGYEAGRLDFNL